MGLLCPTPPYIPPNKARKKGIIEDNYGLLGTIRAYWGLQGLMHALLGIIGASGGLH